MCPEGAQAELYLEQCSPKVVKLSSEVSECKPLNGGDAAQPVTHTVPMSLTRAYGQTSPGVSVPMCSTRAYGLTSPSGRLLRIGMSVQH